MKVVVLTLRDDEKNIRVYTGMSVAQSGFYCILPDSQDVYLRTNKSMRQYGMKSMLMKKAISCPISTISDKKLIVMGKTHVILKMCGAWGIGL